MPVRIFDATDVINIVSDWSIGDPNGVENQDGAAYITDFGNWEIRGSGVCSGGTVVTPANSSLYGTYISTGTIDYAQPPLIPASSSITNIRYRLGCSLEGTATGVPGVDVTAQAQVGAFVGIAGFYDGDLAAFTRNAVPVVQPGFVYVNPDPKSDAFNPVLSSGSNSQAATYFDIPLTYPISYGDLLSLYANLYFQISISIGGGGGSGTTDFTCSFSDFALEVTYVAGTTPFNWYLKTHLSGDGSIIVDDIVDDTDGVPEDTEEFTYILYGSSETYPTEESIPQRVFKKGPVIIIQPIPPGPEWTELSSLTSEEATGALTVTGDSPDITIYTPSVPVVQSGKQWSLHNFSFRHRIEDSR